MEKDFFVSMIKDKMKEDSLSLRDVAKKTGVSHTTVSRILDGQTADIDTILALCKWLEVSPSVILDSSVQGDLGMAAKMAAIIETSPALAAVFEEALSRFEKGKITQQTIEDLVAYMTYRLGLEKKE